MAGKKLLVADDSLTIQKVIRLALSNEGYDLQTVSDGNEALQQVAVWHPDAVLIDVSLPGQSAFEVKRATQTMPERRGTKFILMSSAFERVDEKMATEIGFDGRLTKPFDPGHLRKILQEVLGTATASPAAPAPPAPAPPAPRAPAPPAPPSPVGLDFDDLPTLSGGLGGSASPPPMPASGGGPGDPPPFAEFNDLWDSTPAPPSPTGAADVDPTDEPSFDASVSSSSASPAETGNDGDIRRLTESTIKMSGLDDFQWSVTEPTLQPAPSFSDTDDEPAAPALPPISAEPPRLPRASTSHAVPPPPPPPPASKPSADSSVLALSQGQMDQLIEQKVQEALRRMVQKTLPEVTERLVREELHRLMSDGA